MQHCSNRYRCMHQQHKQAESFKCRTAQGKEKKRKGKKKDRRQQERCLSWLVNTQSPPAFDSAQSLDSSPHFGVMAIQEGRRGRETEHFVLAARPLFNFFSQKTNMNMERFYGEIHQRTEAVLNILLQLLIQGFQPADFSCD